MSAPPLGILVALPLEARCLGSAATRGAPALLSGGTRLLVGGVGPRAAEEGARALLEAGAGALVSLGLAGGLDAALRAGELCLAERVLDCGGQEHPVDGAWRAALLARLGAAGPRCHGGLLVEGARAAKTPQEKRELRARHGAVAVDMESGAAARVARQAGAPFLVARAISDGAARTLPPAALCLDAQGRLRRAPFLRSLARHPGQLPTLLALLADLRAARRALTELWRRAAPDLALPGP